MKLHTSDALAILKEFKIAPKDAKVRDISDFHISHPDPTNTLATFSYGRIVYGILEDGFAEDSVAHIISQTAIRYPGDVFEAIVSPLGDIMTYGLPYQNKDIYLVRKLSSKKRLDIYLAESYPEYSRSSWQKFIKANYVTINGRQIASPKYEIAPTDNVAIDLPDKKDYSDHELPILYIDNDILVINKPNGILTHNKGEMHDEFTVADFVRKYNIDQPQTNRTGIVHRLDRDTSGVIIAARTEKAAIYLKKQFANRKVQKIYTAVISGIPKLPKARIDIPIGRNPAKPSQFRTDSNGKSAQTDYEIMESGKTRSLIRLKPKTGRTHQLRVHMAHIGTVIYGDRVYGTPADRMYLHAQKLTLILPSGQEKTFIAPLPPEFKKIAQK